MNIWQVVVMAVVEGVTEFLPISSTGHLVLTGEVLRVAQTEFVKSFEVAIQLGAILAVVGLYWRRLVMDMKTMKRVMVAFVPTGVLGLIAYPYIRQYLLGNPTVTVVALVVGGGVMVFVERFKTYDSRFKIGELSYGRAVVIGLVQSVSMIPGVSRAMATILGGMGVGLSRAQATEFSFLLAIPTMAAATGLDLIKSGSSFTGGEWGMLGVGFAVAFVTALAAVKWLIGYVQKHDFTAFGMYRIILGVLFGVVYLR